MKKSATATELSPRDTLIGNLTKLHARLKKLTVEAGITEPEYNGLLKALEERTTEDIQSTYDWLLGLEAGAYKEVKKIWEEKPESWWTNIELIFGQRNLRAQRVLRDRRKQLRAAWRSRNGDTIEESGVESFNDGHHGEDEGDEILKVESRPAPVQDDDQEAAE